jgi:hypothetical protein
VSTSSEKPLCLNGGFASHGTHGLAGQDLHATESDNANATVGRHPAENDYDPVQTAYVPKKEAAQPTLEDNFASVQREEAAARLPPAAQRSSVPGLAPADSGFGPPRWWETEDLTPSPAMGSRPDRLPGPFTIMFTIIKISTFFSSALASTSSRS